MVALIAPAGYGKSTVASQFAASGTRLAWLSANDHDSDPTNLVHDVAAAIDRVAPLSAVEIALIGAPGPSVWTAAVPRLGAILARETNLTLVIDDLDKISSTEAIDIIVTLAESVRDRHRVIVTGRTVGRLPAARLVARGALTILDRDQLAMDASSATELAAAAGVTLGEADADDLVETTEGWAAGIYLSLLATSAGRRNAATGQSAHLAVSVDAPERALEAYLRSEVLDTLDADDADLLLGASVLDRMSGPLCDAVLDRKGSGIALDRLERSNLFIIPLDEGRTWYRFHHILGDFLRAELSRRDPSRASTLRRRACSWHIDAGLPEPALEYAMAADDLTQAAALANRLIQPAHNMGRKETIERWLTWFEGRGDVAIDTQLAAQAAMYFSTAGDLPMTEQWLDRAVASLDETSLDKAHEGGSDDSSSDGAPPDHRSTIAIAAIARVMAMREGVGSALRDADLAVAATTDGHRFRVAALAALAASRQTAGDREGSTTAANDAILRWEALRFGHYAACYALIVIASNALAEGDRATAEGAVTKARSIAVSNGLPEHSLAVALEALDARIAMAHGAIPRARADLVHAQRLRPSLTYAFPWLALRGRFDLIRAHLALADPGGARMLLSEVDEIIAMRPEMGALLDERDELATRIGVIRGGQAGASTLTMAELRILPMLTTHLTFREIGERLFVSSNTVKTQAISIYRKLDATSRNEAVERAVELGLLEPTRSPEGFIRHG